MWTALLTAALAADCPQRLPADAGSPASAVYVAKSARSLGYYVHGQLATGPDGPACFDAALGFAPVGTKQQRGDGRTPEGTYRITHRNPNSRFHLSLGVSYPGPADARAGFAAGLISAETRDRILRSPDRPPQDTELGGDIFIHGGGAGTDWTLGCVALSDAHIEWLFAQAGPGTTVIIAP